MQANSVRLGALKASRLAILAGAAIGMAGCVLPKSLTGPSKLPVDATSPVAQEVIKASKTPGPYPTFAEIPPLPTDVRPPSAYAAAVADVREERQTLNAQAGALPPPPTDTESYASRGRSLTEGAGEPAPSDAQQQTEAYANSLRERATPPPAPK